MGSNSTTSSSSGGNSNYDDSLTLNLTIVALAISIAAIVLSTLQALLAYLQFDNSEVGRRRCSEEVMGRLWAEKTTRKFKWKEWRYQVYFEVPVFYTAPPATTIGPLTKTKPKVTLFVRILQKYNAERDEHTGEVTPPEEVAKMEIVEIQKHVQPIYKITGTQTSFAQTMTEYSNENEKWASVHTAEDEGCSWILLLDALQGQEKMSRAWDNPDQSKRGQNHTICYLMQRKRRCWDFMPLNTTKPFATTNICHLVEMMSMLGLVWKAFDVKNADLSAEGNGFMIKSEYVKGLGILTRFSRLTKSVHEENRIVPCVEVKRLCFGEVPSIFDKVKETLQVGPDRLKSSIKRLLPQLDESLHNHLFLDTSESPLLYSCIFELIAMVGKSVHLLGSKFRRLPNPCAHTWTSGFNTAACLDEFAVQIQSPNFGSHAMVREIKGLFRHGRMDALRLSNGETLAYKIKTYFSAKTRLAREKSGPYYPPTVDNESHLQDAQRMYDAALLDLLDSLHKAVEIVDKNLEDLMEEVREVVASHFSTLHLERRKLIEKLADEAKINSKETKEKILVKFYFENIYPTVTQVPKEEETTNDEEIPDSASLHSTGSSNVATLTPAVSDKRKAVWLALMLKQWSWLFLHDFNTEDKMIERSEFRDNRLPVYIG